MKYFVDESGAFLGGWDDDLIPHAGSLEVAYAPRDARQVWNFSSQSWGDIVRSREEVENHRLMAYADPVNGSDRYFAEATRLQAMGGTQAEIDTAKSAGATRYSEIQAQYPWPA